MISWLILLLSIFHFMPPPLSSSWKKKEKNEELDNFNVAKGGSNPKRGSSIAVHLVDKYFGAF